jgi:hypothetical protein
VSIEGTGNCILCIEFCSLTGDEPVDLAFFPGNGVKLPSLALVDVGWSPRTRDFMLKDLRELCSLGRKAAVNVDSDGVMALRQSTKKLIQGMDARLFLSLRCGGLCLCRLCLSLSLGLSLGLAVSINALFFLRLTMSFQGSLTRLTLFLAGATEPA